MARVVSLGVINYREHNKEASPFQQCHFDGNTVTGADLKEILREALRITSQNVGVMVRKVGPGSPVLGDKDTLVSYDYVTYQLYRLAAPRGGSDSVDTPAGVSELLDARDMYTSGTTTAQATQNSQSGEMFRLQALIRKMTESGTLPAPTTPAEVTCPACDCLYQEPMQTSCCGFTACGVCARYLLGSQDKKCPKCGAAAANVVLKVSDAAACAVEKYNEEVAARFAEEAEASKRAGKRPRGRGGVIVSRDVFDKLRALDRELDAQKKRGTGASSSSTLSREEIALAQRVQQSIESSGEVPMPVMSEPLRRKVERYLAQRHHGK
eukprot:PhM_4_TR5409/c0_g1_i1/m.2961